MPVKILEKLMFWRKKKKISSKEPEVSKISGSPFIGAGIKESEMIKILIDEKYVSQADVTAIEKKYRDNLLEGLLSEKLITSDLLGQSVAEHLGVRYIDLNTKEPTQKQILRIPEKVARKFGLVLVSDNKKELVFTTHNPKQKGLHDIFVPMAQKRKINVCYSLPSDIEQSFLHYQKSLDKRFEKIFEGEKHIAPKIINIIIEAAINKGASDIHFEPRSKKEVLVRFRVDGVLQEAGEIPKIHYENITNRIKVQSQLRIDQHLATQDGAMRFESKGNIVDLRVSIAPTLDGEKIVIRILSQYVKQFSLTDLGLSEKHQKIIHIAAKKPFGMILVTGPTGSGKTTTLYALLKTLNNPGVNITTIEDPVEYRITGINQIQVNTETNISFAAGLRSIVRQDPDIILVGEIRDKETAEISVNAALTGHLLFSTFHANDAPTSIPRLLDMGTEPFLLASTLEVVVAQRLVRKICDHCKHSINVGQSDLKKISIKAAKFFPKKSMTLYKGKGCNVCSSTGYKGRTGIFEFIEVTPRMKDLILENPSTQKIWEVARREGATSFFEDGVEKVRDGVTTLEELLRVAAPPEELVKITKKTVKKTAK